MNADPTWLRARGVVCSEGRRPPGQCEATCTESFAPGGRARCTEQTLAVAHLGRHALGRDGARAPFVLFQRALAAAEHPHSSTAEGAPRPSWASGRGGAPRGAEPRRTKGSCGTTVFEPEAPACACETLRRGYFETVCSEAGFATSVTAGLGRFF